MIASAPIFSSLLVLNIWCCVLLYPKSIGDQVNKRGALNGGYIDNRRSRIEAMKETKRSRATLNEMSQREQELNQDIDTQDQLVSKILGDMGKENSRKAHLRNSAGQIAIDIDTENKKRELMQTQFEELVGDSDAWFWIFL